MNQETRSEILSLYSDKANDGILRDLQSVMKKLREKWKREFERRAKQMAEWLADKTQKRCTEAVKKHGVCANTELHRCTKGRDCKICGRKRKPHKNDTDELSE